jgi:hypothetical protein
MKTNISILVLFLFGLIGSTNLLAQKDANTPKVSTSLYFELLGAGGLYSVNIEPKVVIKPQHQVGLRVGFSYLKASFNTRSFSLPVLAVYCWQPNAQKNHWLELGAGFNKYNEKALSRDGFLPGKDASGIPPVLLIGYRNQKPNGFLFKASICTFFDKSVSVIPSVGIGYTF